MKTGIGTGKLISDLSDLLFFLIMLLKYINKKDKYIYNKYQIYIAAPHHSSLYRKDKQMSLKGKVIKSRATGITGKISGYDKKNLRITFTRFQDISVPLLKAESVLEMDDEALEELRKLVKAIESDKNKDPEESKVMTYIDSEEEEEEEEILEEPEVNMTFEGEEKD